MSGKGVFEGFDVFVFVDFVDGYEEWAEAGKVHEEVVDWELDVFAVFAYGAHEREAVGAAEGMVACDDGVAVGGDAFGVNDIDGYA